MFLFNLNIKWFNLGLINFFIVSLIVLVELGSVKIKVLL